MNAKCVLGLLGSGLVALALVVVVLVALGGVSEAGAQEVAQTGGGFLKISSMEVTPVYVVPGQVVTTIVELRAQWGIPAAETTTLTMTMPTGDLYVKVFPVPTVSETVVVTHSAAGEPYGDKKVVADTWRLSGGGDHVTRWYHSNPNPPEAIFRCWPLEGTAPMVTTCHNWSYNYLSSLWDYGDGITSTLQEWPHTYTMAGEFTVTLTVTGPGGTDTLVRPNYITVTEPEIPALQVSKTNTDKVQAGQLLTYTIHVTNTGNIDLHAIVTDTLPGHVSGWTSGTVILPGGVLTWTSVISMSGVLSITFDVIVLAGYSGTLTNTVQVTTLEGAAGSATATTFVEPRPTFKLFLPLLMR